MRSLETFYALDATAVYPGHGAEFGDPHRKVIDRQRERIGKRKEQCFDLVSAGNHTIIASPTSCMLIFQMTQKSPVLQWCWAILIC